MKKFNIVFIVTVVVILIAGAFYWYELRPPQIRKQCNEWKKIEEYEWNKHEHGKWRPTTPEEYKQCLREHGVNE